MAGKNRGDLHGLSKYIRKIISILVLTILISGSPLMAELPVFEAGVALMAGEEVIPGQGNHHTAPCVHDWDGDGDPDLMVGSFTDGPVFYYRNTAGERSPVLEAQGLMEADGEVISAPYDWCQGAYPQIADFDNDGDFDLLVGDATGYITFYVRNDNGDLSNGGYIQADGEDLFQAHDSPCTVDWDLDGDLDLLVGNASGTITLYMNTGSPEEYEFEAAGNLEANEEEIWLGSETAAEIADLDGDGKRDLILGSIFGELWFYPNTNEDDDPVFGEGVRLSDENGDIAVFGYSRPEVIDWDSDGDLDMVVGLVYEEVWVFINPADNSVSDTDPDLPSSFSIVGNYPNPFNGSTRLQFTSDRTQQVNLELINSFGQRVYSKNLGVVTTGTHYELIDMNSMGTGNYFLRLNSSNQTLTKAITFIK